MHPRERPRGYGCCGLSAPTVAPCSNFHEIAMPTGVQQSYNRAWRGFYVERAEGGARFRAWSQIPVYGWYVLACIIFARGNIVRACMLSDILGVGVGSGPSGVRIEYVEHQEGWEHI
eukprot:347091-Amorphochlora_amoeboformis.AAC.1